MMHTVRRISTPMIILRHVIRHVIRHAQTLLDCLEREVLFLIDLVNVVRPGSVQYM